MAEGHFSRQNLDFILYEALKVEELCAYELFSGHNRETFDFTLDASADIAERYLKPFYTEADRREPQLENGTVKVHPALHDYFRAFAESGLLSATFPTEWDGQQLPRTIAAASQAILGGANNSFVMYTDLVKGVGRLIEAFGNNGQKTLYLPQLLSGRWGATMCLTESQAGSALSDITTSARPLDDEAYTITGQKIFISAGDHDLTENIVHMVLARIDGAPAGTKGISLFIVPKKRPDENGTLVDNDVASIGIYHKMGQKATPAMHLEFGGKGDCVGSLVGEPHKGLLYMFQMMNGARLDVGLSGVYVAQSAYYASLQYAKERVQGRRAGAKDPNEAPVSIIQHADVRRMLLSQKAFAEGAMAFVLQCFKYLDLEKAGNEKEKYNALLELLTPVAKAYGSDGGYASVNGALQVLGGYGYTSDFPIEQMVRDSRIFPVYEGTNGIQSIALLGRQVPMNEGESLKLWWAEVGADLERCPDSLVKYRRQLEKEIEDFKLATGFLMKAMKEEGVEAGLSDASLYMELFGTLNMGWQWLKMAGVAEAALLLNTLSPDRRTFYRSKIETMLFFFRYELPKCNMLCRQLMDTDRLTLFDDEEEILI